MRINIGNNLKQYFLIYFVFALTILSYTRIDTRKFIILAGLAIALICVAYKAKIRIRLSFNEKAWISLCIIALAASVFASISVTVYRSKALSVSEYIDALQVFCAMPFALMVICSYAKKDRYLRFLRDLSVVMGFFCVLEKVFDTKLFLWLYSNVIDSATVERPSLFVGHPIYLSVYLMVGAIILIQKPYKKGVVNYFSWVCILVGLYFAEARSVWISLAGAVCLNIIAKKKNSISRIKKEKIFAIIATCLILIIALAFSNIPELILTKLSALMDVLLNSANTDSSRNIRFSNALNAIGFLMNNGRYIVIGGGEGFSLLFLKNNPSLYGWTDALDNQYLTFILNYGVFSLVPLICILIRTIISIFKNAGKKADEMAIDLIIFAMYISMFFFETLGEITGVFAVFLSMVFLSNRNDN